MLARKRRKQLTATLEMKLAQSSPLNPDAPKTVADLKYGMSSINKTGIQQNTTCFFDCQEVEIKKPKKDEELADVTSLAEHCKDHCGVKKVRVDQFNPYLKCKYIIIKIFLR